jgi:hypothetical protein
MMENHEKGLGMRSDRPGIMPNNLDLDVSPHVLERERERAFEGMGSVWWRVKETWAYKSTGGRSHNSA